MMSQLIRFAAVGALGFLIDAGALLVFVALGVGPLPGRIASFLLAATVTFFLNHRFTFRSAAAPSVQRWSYYVLTTACGALLNVGVYQIWVTLHDASSFHLVIGTALGSLAAMCVNYCLSRFLVFRDDIAFSRGSH